METDAFFCQLLKQLPETLFELLGMPGELARRYRFDSIELKKSLRIDGLFVPSRTDLPLYFVEVQFQRVAKFYANLFAKVFSYADENNPGQEWMAVALFGSRRCEPRQINPYRELIESPRVRRIYLDELKVPADPPVGLGLLQLLSAPPDQAKALVSRLMNKAERIADRETRRVIELVEEVLIRQFPKFGREEIRAMFNLHDLRKTRVWQEALQEGREEGREEGANETRRELVRKCLDKGMPHKAIAELMEISVQEVRRLAKDAGS